MPMPSALGARYLGSVLPSPQLMGLESVMAVGAGALPVSVFGTKGSRSEGAMGTERMLAPRWVENSVHSKEYGWLMELWDSVRTVCVRPCPCSAFVRGQRAGVWSA